MSANPRFLPKALHLKVTMAGDKQPELVPPMEHVPVSRPVEKPGAVPVLPNPNPESGPARKNTVTTSPEPDVEDLGSLTKKKTPFSPRPACFKSTLQEVTFTLTTIAATATSTFFLGVSSILTASIGISLSMTQPQITFITASTALTAGAFQLGLGQLADLLNRRTMFLAGMGSFSLLSLLVGWTQNPYWMVVVCGVVGVSAAMVVPPTIGIMGAAYDKPSRRKNLAFSAFGAGNPLGFVFGSMVSGVAAMIWGWRASFFGIAVLWAVFTCAVVWTVPKGVEAFPEGQKFGARVMEGIGKFDALGTLLTVLGALRPSDGWNTGHVVAMLVLGVIFLALFAFWERVCAHPLMPSHIWKNRNFTFIILTCLPGAMSFNNVSPLMITVYLLPQAVAGLVYNAIAGSILHRVNNTFLLGLGSVAYISSNVLYSLMRPDSLYWTLMFPALMLSVIGADFQFNVIDMCQTLAGGIFNSIFRLGAAVALGLSTAVFDSAAASPVLIEDPMVRTQEHFKLP
ncbi:major facilitator superfamily domain-containing protein [Triangularia setosa]|uniref:Major facilitator superfamily domain-containing protein n=1 Tax=Triangularia setosa TaxID=2587417 RepID=A0AAN7A5T1_9PEZI|nr:major facilitator superfamily domain-containing protein [Podospora setosa]